jgi:hypothetical protein
MANNTTVESYATQQRRKSRREEWRTQTRLATLLTRYLPDDAFWSSLENTPRTRLSGYLQRQRGCRAGLPDLLVVHQAKTIGIEVKSRRGVPSRTQKQICAELRAAGAEYWLVRSARAALAALARSNVPLHRWKVVQLQPWEGPFADLNQRLPQEPHVAAERRAARKRWRERQRARAAAQIAPETLPAPSEAA